MHSPTDDDSEPVSRMPHPWDRLVGRRASSSGLPAHERFVEWMTQVGEVGGNVLVYSSLYISVIAMAEVAIAMMLLSMRPNVSPVVIGLVTFAVYTNDRIADAPTDMVSNPRQATFVIRHRNSLYVLAALAYGIAITLGVLHGPAALVVTLVPGLFWIVYASDWVPDPARRFRRLKELLVINSLVVALAWAVTLTFLPLTFTDAPLTPAVGVVFLYFLVRSFVDTEIPNVRDVEGDRAIDVSTLPTVFGIARTRKLLLGIDLATVAFVALAVRAGLLGSAAAVALVAGVAVSVVVVSLVGRVEDIDTLSIASQFEYVVVFGVLATANLWP